MAEQSAPIISSMHEARTGYLDYGHQAAVPRLCAACDHTPNGHALMHDKDRRAKTDKKLVFALQRPEAHSRKYRNHLQAMSRQLMITTD